MKQAKSKNIRVAVLLGGGSSERQVSLSSGKQVIKNLPQPYVGKAYDPTKKLAQLATDIRHQRIEIVFNALHGGEGENGLIQAWLELHKIPYTGSGVLASALAMDKAMSKRVFNDSGLPTAKGVKIFMREWLLHPKELLQLVSRELGGSIVIKPNASGSSVGVTVNPAKEAWEISITKAIEEDGQACLVERFYPGREFSVGVLDSDGVPEALPVIEIKSKHDFFDYAAKYEGESEEICPADITQSMEKEMRRLAVLAHTALGCSGYSRTDIIWSRRGPIVLETNTLPGLTKMSLLPQEAAVAGIDFPTLLGRILQEADKKT